MCVGSELYGEECSVLAAVVIVVERRLCFEYWVLSAEEEFGGHGKLGLHSQIGR